MPALKWTEEKIRAEAAKYETKAEFKKGAPRAYDRAQYYNLLDTLGFVNQARNWTDQELLAEALKYETRTEFQTRAASAYALVLRRGLLSQLTIPSKVRRWSIEDVLIEAAIYNSKSEFKLACPSGYQAGKRFGVLDSIFTNRHDQWCETSVRTIAASCRTKTELMRNHPKAYHAAHRLKIIDSMGLPSHVNGQDNDAIYIWRAVGQHYNGHPVYKIGVTSARLGTARVEQVARAGGFEFELICCEPVQCKATELERKLHILGEDPKFVGFDGATEFRALSDSALYAAVSMICEAM